MREGLREIADQALERGIVFFAQEADFVGQPNQPPEQRLRLVIALLQYVDVDQPKAAGKECTFAGR
jgi:hypothetical protein